MDTHTHTSTMNHQAASPRILVIRNDKIGDFMLAWPALALLRRSLPKAHLSVLVPSYTQALANICPWIDEVLTDPQHLDKINNTHFDILLTLFSTNRIGWAGWKGHIPLRVGPATKWAQIFYNKRLTQRRSHSLKPEFEYNLDLVHYLLQQLNIPAVGNPAPYWPLATAERAHQRNQLARLLNLPLETSWLFVHAGSGGSAVNLTTNHYARLIQNIDRLWPESMRPTWILTAGPAELPLAQSLQKSLSSLPSLVRCYESAGGLSEFALSLSAADLFIAGSTGPLHIAATLDVPTVGFFPAKRSATALRWRPCNSPGRTISFSAKANAPDTMGSIDLDAAAQAICDWFPSLIEQKGKLAG